jgi:hypothetical protein
MKKVFSSHRDVCHVFAQQSQYQGQASNIFFEGPAIYSYGHHFLMGLFVTNDKGEEAILLNGYSYSTSTAKHQGILRQSTRQYKQITLPYLRSDSGRAQQWREGTTSEKLRETTSEVVESSLAKLKDIEKKLSNARKPEIYIHQAQQINHTISEYFLFIGIDVPAELQDALKICTPTPAILEAIKERQRQEAEREQARQREQIEKWLSGEIDYPGRLSYDILRRKGEGVETSQGVKMTIQEAKAIYLQLLNQQLKPGDQVLQAGYKVISVNGTVKIGCHTFQTDYLLTFGKSI